MRMRSLWDFQSLTRQTGSRLVALGLLFIGFALAFPRIPALYERVSSNGADFVVGLFFGVAIALEVAGVVALFFGRKGSEGR